MTARMTRFTAALAAFALAVFPRAAHASLTPAEAAQVREFYAGAKAADAAQTRALVARPDLTADESAQALSAAMGGVAFTPSRAAFVKTLLFGGQSLPSRSVLTIAATHGLLARVNDVISKNEGDFDAHADGVAEVTRIYAFLDQEIAAAGPKRGVGAPPESGISAATYDEAAKAIGDSLATHPKWLKSDAQLSVAASKVRAQAELALLDMTNDSPTFRVDVAEKLALAGARRSFFLELGVLPLDDSKAPDARIEAARNIFLRMPAGRMAVSGVFFGDDKATFASKKEVLAVKSSLSNAGPAIDQLPEDLASALPDGVAKVDSSIADLTHRLALCTVRHALENRGDLALQATQDARAAIDAKMPLGKLLPTTSAAADASATLAQAVELVALDAHGAFDIARNRFRANHPEPAALFSDAVGVLAVNAASPPSGSGLALAVGKPKSDGTSETVVAQNVQLAPTGAAVSLSLGPWILNVPRDAGGAVTSVSAIGKPGHPPSTTTGAPPKKGESKPAKSK